MNRRSMLAGLGGMLAIGATAQAATPPADEHTYKGYRVRWAGWRQPPNQFAEFGFWVADGRGETRFGSPCFRYSTTLGVCDVAVECEVLDTSSPWRTFNPEPSEREALKARALRHLYEWL